MRGGGGGSEGEQSEEAEVYHGRMVLMVMCGAVRILI